MDINNTIYHINYHSYTYFEIWVMRCIVTVLYNILFLFKTVTLPTLSSADQICGEPYALVEISLY